MPFASVLSIWKREALVCSKRPLGGWDFISAWPRPAGSLQADFFLDRVLHQLNGDDPISLLRWVTVRNSQIMCWKPLECYGTQRHSEFQVLCAQGEALLVVRHADRFRAISVSA